MVDKIIKEFASKGVVCVLTPDNYPQKKNVYRYSTDRNFEEILKLVKKQNIDVINCHTFYLADLAIYLSKELQKPLVFTLHGVFIKYYGEKYRELLRKIYDNSDKIITVSDNYRNSLSKYIRDVSKIITIKNGIDLEPIDSLNKAKEYYRDKNKIPLNKFVIVVPARLTYIKGLDYLIKALNKIKDKEILVFICSPKGRKNKEEVVYKNKLKSVLHNNLPILRFKYLDNGEMFEYYKSADLVLLPSLIEGISISILEAMAFSKTIVTTDVGGNPEVIDNKRDGYLIKPRSSKAIFDVIRQIKENDNILIGKSARKKVEKDFLSSKMFNDYYKVFKQVIYENK
ncbi:MAG: glycosyltransferase family 4 protein [Candidatus Pacebacteria bacterium]|nr:glycosyltransferase family 4 protein [Candidatus Paceibacterota bacterium]